MEPVANRLLLVSNRLPVAVRVDGDALAVDRTAGGLGTGLGDFHESGDGLWIGWPGETSEIPEDLRPELRAVLAEKRFVPVELTADEVRRYYNDFANGVLWPLLHYQFDRLPLAPTGWTTYQAVNERFADAVVESYRPGDVIWVHDYHLMLVPELVRRRLPDAAIGYFLHVPFPSSELFRILPARRQLLEGMLGASLIGFHTAAYANHFVSAAGKILGCQTRSGRVWLDGRVIAVGGFPMGIDAGRYEARASSPETLKEVEELRRPGQDLIVAVDRLDYTKGIPQRLLAFERLLERHPELRGKVALTQVAAPSRENVGAYRQIRRTVDELVGRINGQFAVPGYDPIHYLGTTLPPERLAALYRAAAVAMITPLRDGMNLVAKEFVASRVDGDGVLVLSEFAGAAAELSGAVLVNPYDLDQVAEALHSALAMPVRDRRARMKNLRRRVRWHDVHRWAREFLAAVVAPDRRTGLGSVRPEASQMTAPETIIDELLTPPPPAITVIVDYDGTLVPFRERPEEGAPDEELLHLLLELQGLADVDVHVVSGRRQEDLAHWLGHLSIGLHAEHGRVSRDAGPLTWPGAPGDKPEWMAAVRRLMDAHAARMPSSFVEEKAYALAWHYRMVREPEGSSAAASLRRGLASLVKGTAAQVIAGHRVVEVREQSANKGLVVRALAAAHPERRLLIAGDDATDEDMFMSAPPTAVTIKIGPGRTRARYQLAGPEQLRSLLRAIAQRLSERSQPEHVHDQDGGSLVAAGGGVGTAPAA